MIRYTTPSVVLRVPIDITDARIIVSFKQGTGQALECAVSRDDVSLEDGETIIKVQLTQAQTARLKANALCRVQVNWIYADGLRNATTEKTIKISDNLLEKVVRYGE